MFNSIECCICLCFCLISAVTEDNLNAAVMNLKSASLPAWRRLSYLLSAGRAHVFPGSPVMSVWGLFVLAWECGLAPCRMSAYRRWLFGSGWRWRSHPPAVQSFLQPLPWPLLWWCPLSCGWTPQVWCTCLGRPWTGTPNTMTITRHK